MSEELLQFNLSSSETLSNIKVIGVGGGGSNAVNYMYSNGINGVDFVVCNTDAQALAKSPIEHKIQLGAELTKGRGAGARPEVGRQAALESIEEIKSLFSEDIQMVFITAGMGGGTGTGAAPVIAQAAKEMGILTVGIVTIPFAFENKKRTQQANDGIEEMRKAVDTLLIIRNDKLRELYGNLSLTNAFGHADNVLCTAAKSIAELITLTGLVNVDMNDVITVMRGSGVAIMGSGKASGDGQAIRAVEAAMESPLLNDNDINGAAHILLNIMHGHVELTMDEIGEITDYIQEQAGPEADIIWGYGKDENLGEDISVTVIATGFQAKEIPTLLPLEEKAPIENTPVYVLGEVAPSPVLPVVETIEPVAVSEPIAPVVEVPTVTEMPVAVTEIPQEELSVEETPFKLVVADEIEFEVENTWNEVQEEKVEEPVQGALFSFADYLAQEEAQEEIQPKMDASQDIESVSLVEPEIPELTTFKLKVNETTSEEPVAPIMNMSRPVENEAPAVSMTFKQEEQHLTEHRPPRTELMARNKEREARIREFTMRMKSPQGLNELESEPAFVRRKVALDETPHSSENTLSRTISKEVTDENGNVRIELRKNNPFLHDNVD